MFYNKEGKEISVQEFTKLFEDKNYQVIKQDKLSNGYFISTVWLGINHSFVFSEKLLLFETMVFDSNKSSVEQKRYSTEKQALRGHKRFIKEYKDKFTIKIDLKN